VPWLGNANANLEVIWLMRTLCPSYKMIADFRQRNAQALRQVHVQFIALCRALNLLGGKRVAVDGSYFNGNVSDASFHSVKRLAEDIESWGAGLTNGSTHWIRRIVTIWSRPHATPICLSSWKS